MQALDRAKAVQRTLTRLVERREQRTARAQAEFRLDLLAAIDTVDDETIALVQRGLAIDRCEAGLQYALQLAVDERNEARRRAVDPLADTRRSGDDDDLHEAETILPPALPSTVEVGDADLIVLDDEVPGPERYPEPGEPAVELPDGRIVAAT